MKVKTMDLSKKVAGASCSRVIAPMELEAPATLSIHHSNLPHLMSVTKTLQPELRFPEFREAKGWENKKLELALKPIIRKNNKPQEPYTGMGLRSHGKGTFLKPNESPEKNSMEFLYEVKEDDLIVNITFAWEGAIAIVGNSDDGALVSHRFPTFLFNRETAIPEFFRYTILDKFFIYQLGVISPGGAGRNRVLNKKDFLKLGMNLPTVPEQQKIADCLGSLDELIAAHSAKLDALKDHKKGLLQQLFPSEGETTPKLRFQEFENAGDWSDLAIKDACQLKAGKYVKASSISGTSNNGCLYPCYGGNGLRGYTATFNHEGEYALVGRQGAHCGNVKLVKQKFHATEHALVATPSKGILSIWLYYGLALLNLNQFATGQAQPGLSVDVLNRIPVRIPSQKEQQRIADCLSDLDALITAQTEEIEALKTHKKGLMQKLFPTETK